MGNSTRNPRVRSRRDPRQYLLLIYNNETEASARSAEEKRKTYADYGAFTKSIIGSGHFKAGDALQPVATGG